MALPVGAMFSKPRLAPSLERGDRLRMMSRKNKSYQFEIKVDEGESIDSAMRRFRRYFLASKVFFEVRRRRTFENTQDIKKRKMKEKGEFKRLPDPIPWYEVHSEMEPHPFDDMFGPTEDVFSPMTAWDPYDYPEGPPEPRDPQNIFDLDTVFTEAAEESPYASDPMMPAGAYDETTVGYGP